jgi:hypothetical protein
MPTASADNPAARALAIASALEAMFAARHDDATARFDAELTAAVADGRLDEATARTLRWWQRASVRGAQNYLADLLPGVLHADDAAHRRSRANAELAAASWQEATGAAAAVHTAARHRYDDDGQPDASAQAFPAEEGDPAQEPADHGESPLRVRLVAVPRHAAHGSDTGLTSAPNGKDTPGDDHSATTARA